MTLDKVNCEPELQHLLIKLIKVYGFMSQEKKLSLMLGIVGQVARQTLECACFMRDYSKFKIFCECQQVIVLCSFSTL
jgi:hypothetical protein